jgi:undecaprenyl-diphosphatase
MNYLQAIMFGVVEGVTEFLPVSSTYHLLQVAQLLHIEQTEFVKLFEVVIQGGAVFAIFFLFQKELWMTKRLYLKLLVSTLPIIIFGYFLHSIIKNVFFENADYLTYVFIAVGVLFLFVEYFVGKNSYRLQKGLLDVTYFQAFVIGLFQVLALVPGVSRSGSVIVAMMLTNFKREDAGAYSLALAVPTILSATLYDLYRSRDLFMTNDVTNSFDVLVIGFITSFVVAYFVARWFISFLRKHTLYTFGIYRLIVGIILLAVSAF